MAVPAIPVLSFRPNWKEGVTESLIWLTTVLQSDTGAEQRRAMRISPGRQVEASFVLQGAERTFFDLFMSRAGSEEMFIPLHWDIGRLGSARPAGAERLEFDTRWREFQEGGFAIIQGKDALTYEVVEIISIDDDGLDLAAPLAQPWPRGSKIMPLRRGRINPDDNTGFEKHNSRVAESSFRWNFTEPNDWAETEADDSPVYMGHPIFTLTPDLNDRINMEFARKLYALGNDFGKSFYADAADRAFVAQGHAWFLKGRRAQARFRDFLYRMRGRARSFWLPTFNDDLTLAQAYGAGVDVIEVQKAGYGLAGGPGKGRDHIAIFLRSGQVIVRKVLALLNPSVTWRERLKLSAVLGTAIDPATVKRISFCDLARLDQDQFDLSHHTDTDGVTTANAVFRTFGDTRDPSGIIFLPIPETAMNAEDCGVQADPDPCIPRTCPPSTVFAWDLAFNGCKEFYCPTRNWGMPLITGHPANFQTKPNLPYLAPGETYAMYDSNGWPGQSIGNTLAIWNNCSTPEGINYESDAYINPDSPWYQDPRAARLQGQPLLSWSTSNGDCSMTIHGALVDGGGYLQVQYGAFWCGDFVAQGTLTRTLLIDCKPVGATLIESGLVGNVPYTWSW